MLIGPRGKRLHDFTVKINENTISQTNSTKYLGVYIDDKLTWSVPTLRKLFRAVLEFSIELDTILTTPISWACFFVATNILDVSQFVKMLWFMSLYYEILIVVLSLYFLCCYFSLSTFHL